MASARSEAERLIKQIRKNAEQGKEHAVAEAVKECKMKFDEEETKWRERLHAGGADTSGPLLQT